MGLVSREDRLRVVVGVAAGIVTAVALIAFWILMGGAAADPDFRAALTAGDTAAERAAGERTARLTTGRIAEAVLHGAAEHRADGAQRT